MNLGLSLFFGFLLFAFFIEWVHINLTIQLQLQICALLWLFFFQIKIHPLWLYKNFLLHYLCYLCSTFDLIPSELIFFRLCQINYLLRYQWIRLVEFAFFWIIFYLFFLKCVAFFWFSGRDRARLVVSWLLLVSA